MIQLEILKILKQMQLDMKRSTQSWIHTTLIPPAADLGKHKQAETSIQESQILFF